MCLFEEFLTYRPYCFTLSNGLKVIFLPVDHTDLVAIQAWVKTGSIHEDKYLGAGISHFVEHMVFKGTERRTYADIFSEAQASGASLNAYTSFDRTVYTYDGLSASTELGLDILSDMLLHPTFPEEEMRKEKKVILREIDMCNDDPDDRLNQIVFENAFRRHPYRFPIIGIKSIFEQLTRENLMEYWRERYPVNNMTLVIVGHLSFEWIQEKVKHYFSACLPSSLRPILIPREPFQMAERVERFYGDYQLVRGALAFKIPGLGHKDGAKLQVLSNVLGCGDSSLLHQKLREELRYVYSIDVSTWMADQGLFWIQYVCDGEKRACVEEFLSKNLQCMAEAGIETKHVQKALNQAIISEIDAQKTVSGQAHHLGWADTCLGDLQYARHYLEQLKQLDAKSVIAIVRKYLKPTICTTVSLEPKALERGFLKKSTAVHTHLVESTTLPNGVRLVMQYNPSFPKTHVQILGLGGALYEPVHQRGISHLVASLLMKDTQKHTAREIAETIDAMGGQFNSFTGVNHIGLAFEVLSQNTAMGCHLLREMLSMPRFKEETFKVEKASQLASIQEMMDDVFYVGFKKMRRQFFGQHPYAIGQYGIDEDVKALRLEQCWDYFKKIFVSSNCVISAVSPMPTDELIKLLEPMGNEISEGCFKKVSDEIFFNSERDCECQWNKEQSMVFRAYPMAGICSKDYYVADYLEELFNGLSSQFVIEVREKLGLAYTVGATRLTGLNRSMLCLFAGTQASHLKTVESEMCKATQRVLDRQVSSKEFNLCRAHLKVSQQTRLQTIAKKAFYAGINALFDLPQDAWLNYEKAIDDISLEEFFERSKAYLQPDLSHTLLISSEM
ncbi:MAG: insulinase family protein [Puniceicoccales bacterium]|jgi:zinc protease|nr:insulinase family protein [Puniceicoccales bacterium]